MDPLTIVTSAAAIARAAGLSDWLRARFADQPSAEAAARMVDLATSVTGASDPREAIRKISSDLEARDRARAALLEWEQELVRLQLADVDSARALYQRANESAEPRQADRIARQIMSWNLPAIVGLVGANCAAVYYISNATVAVALGNVIGASITYLWNERSQVVGFFFGSSLGSKDKQALLSGRQQQ